MSSAKSRPTANRAAPIAVPSYLGRFAPSPTGSLHFGSLLSAVASYLDARHHAGRWLVRIEDLDPPREVSGARDDILRTLEAHALVWDGDVANQSDHIARYGHALGRLADRGVLFFCNCSRRDLAASVGPYSGRCREVIARPDYPAAVRIRAPAHSIEFCDLRCGPQCESLATTSGDFVLRRRDGLFSYQLAVVVDDAEANVTHIVRGVDLLDNTARQIYLQQLLEYDTPSYLHLPVVVNDQGNKLSKQTLAPPLDSARASANIRRVLTALGHPLPPELRTEKPHVQLSWAVEHWQRARIPHDHALRIVDPEGVAGPVREAQ